MLLSDAELFQAVLSGELGVDPFRFHLIQPASIDVRLSCRFRVFPQQWHTHIDPREKQELTELVTVCGEGEDFILHPGQFALGSTIERITLPAHLAARLEGKSSLGRVGLLIHAAGFIDPGFSGQITLELSNVSPLPIKLWPGMAIGQLCVMHMSTPASVPYGPERGSRYQGQHGPTPSRMAA